MKFYIVGIDFNVDSTIPRPEESISLQALPDDYKLEYSDFFEIQKNQHLKELIIKSIGSTKSSLILLMKAIPIIMQDAIKELGTDVITVIVLHEYALTPYATHKRASKCILDKLQSIVNKYDNLILIPGSIATFQDISKLRTEKVKRRIKKIDLGYDYMEEMGNTHDIRKEDDEIIIYTDALARFNEKLQHPEQQPFSHFELKNTAHILTRDNPRIEHSKFNPYYEDQRFLPSYFNCFRDYSYCIKKDELVKQIRINQSKIDLGILICVESLYKMAGWKILMKQPLILVTLAMNRPDSKHIPHRFGAINILKDDLKLSVEKNESHPLAQNIQTILIYQYKFLLSGTTLKMNKKPKPLKTLKANAREGRYANFFQLPEEIKDPFIGEKKSRMRQAREEKIRKRNNKIHHSN